VVTHRELRSTASMLVRRTAARLTAAGLMIAPMSAMASVHEQVEQRAGEKQQPGQVRHEPDEMRAMLRHQEESGDRQKSDDGEVDAGCEKAVPAAVVATVIHLQLRRSLASSNSALIATRTAPCP